MIVELGLMPVLIQYFGQVSIAGLATNFFIVPAADVLLMVGLTCGSVGALWPAFVPQFATDLIHYFLSALIYTIHWFGDKPWAVLNLNRWPVALQIFYDGVFICLLMILNATLTRRKHR